MNLEGFFQRWIIPLIWSYCVNKCSTCHMSCSTMSKELYQYLLQRNMYFPLPEYLILSFFIFLSFHQYQTSYLLLVILCIQMFPFLCSPDYVQLYEFLLISNKFGVYFANFLTLKEVQHATILIHNYCTTTGTFLSWRIC